VVAWIVRVSVRGLYWEVEFFFGDFSKKRGFMTWEKSEVWDGYRSGGAVEHCFRYIGSLVRSQNNSCPLESTTRYDYIIVL
jgi:hypothetical protein